MIPAGADAPIVAALPGGGWRIEYDAIRPKDGSTFSDPVLAWLVRANGETYPISTDSSGLTDDPTDASNFRRVYHPDEEQEGAP